MKQDLQNQIFLRFPESWFDRTHPGRSLLCSGLEVGDGWFALLWSLFERIEFELEGKTEFEIVQVKEKWGSLCIYWKGFSRGDDAEKLDDKTFSKIEYWVQQAEEISSKICEDCGRMERRRGGSWVRTLCGVCGKSRKAGA